MTLASCFSASANHAVATDRADMGMADRFLDVTAEVQYFRHCLICIGEGLEG